MSQKLFARKLPSGRFIHCPWHYYNNDERKKKCCLNETGELFVDIFSFVN